MQVTVKLYASFRWNLFDQAVRECPAGTTIGGLAAELGIPLEQIGIKLVNGRHSSLDQVLEEGDVVSLMPLIGGG